MRDRVEKFVEEFEAAIDTRSRQSERRQFIDRAARQSAQLAESLDLLAGKGLITAAVTPDDLRALHDELSAGQEPTQLEPLIANAKALVKVVEDGIVEGDLARLRAALTRAEEIRPPTGLSRRSSQARLSAPVRVRCTSCDDIVVGRRRGGALNWQHLMKELREHARGQHGDYTQELRDDLAQAREQLDAGDTLVEVGRYKLGQF